MKLSTPVRITDPIHKYSYKDKFTCLGSCFAGEIGSKLESLLFKSITNPLGTIFNPIALAAVLERAIEKKRFHEDEFFERNELWLHPLVHSSLASTQLKESVENANAALEELHGYLYRSELLILTLGTAWSYKSKDTNRPVGHNHRLPLESFDRELIPPQEIETRLLNSLSLLNSFNPSCHVCITVSPVRHLKDGLHENNLSKSSLLLAAHAITSKTSKVEYFPAYELMIDELRDYRYYSDDMAHPSRLAVKYIWDQFATSYLTPETLAESAQVESINTALSHRPHHPDTKSYDAFKADLQRRMDKLASQGIDSVSLQLKWTQLP